MKKLIPALLLSLTLTTTFVPRESEAGLLIGTLAGAPGTGLAIGAIVGVVTYGGGVVFVDGYRHDTFILFGGGSVLGMALLDVDASLTPDHLTEVYKKSFPFVDSTETIQQLTEMTKAKFSAQALNNPDAEQTLVSFTPEELTPVFQGTDITDAQFNYVVEQLK